MGNERLNAAIAEMAKQDITFANCDSTWQKRVMTAVLEASDTRPAAPFEGLEKEECCPACGGKGRIGPFFPGGMSAICANCKTHESYANETRKEVFNLAKKLWSADGNWRLWSSEDREIYAMRAVNLIIKSRIQADNAALTARVKEEAKQAGNTQARLTTMSKTILRLRDVLILVTDNIEDDADRAYFGSSNDADTLKDVVEELDGWTWDDIISDGKLPDVYETSRNAINRAEALETQLAAAWKALDFYGDVHKYPAPLTGGMGALWSDCGAIARAALESRQ